MPDPLTLQQRHLCMSHIRSKGTSSELSCGMSCGAGGGTVKERMCAGCWESDLRNNQRLESNAWNIITVWGCELDKAHL